MGACIDGICLACEQVDWERADFSARDSIYGLHQTHVLTVRRLLDSGKVARFS